MAEVHVAEMTLARGMRRRVALKRIHPHLTEDPEFVNMFLDEARVASQLTHPGIVPVVDAVEDHGDLLLVLDYVPGWDLSNISREAQRTGVLLPIAAVIAIAHQVAAILAYVHGAVDSEERPLSIIHRDVTPSNVLLAHDGTTRLLDFGVAKAAARATRTATRSFKGKLAYMAPEQAMGDDVDPRTDLYALGLIVFELLTNVRAIDAEGDIQLLELARRPHHLPIRSLRPDAPAALEEFVAHLLAIDPRDRPANAEEVVGALDGLLPGGIDAARAEIRALVIDLMGAPSRPVGRKRNTLERAIAMAAGLGGTARRQGTAKRVRAPQADGDSGVREVDDGEAPPPDGFAGAASIDPNTKEFALAQLVARGERALDGEADSIADANPAPSGSAAAPIERASHDPANEGRSRRAPWTRVLVGLALVAVAAIAYFVWPSPASPGSASTGDRPSVPIPPPPSRGGAAMAPGFLRITSSPAGATVAIDGRPWHEVTPTVVDVAPNRYVDVSLELEGRSAFRETVAAEPGQTMQVHGELALLSGAIAITSEPSGAEVSIDGEPRGRTPLELDDLDRRAISVRIELADHRPHVERVDLTDQVRASLHAVLRSARQSTGLLDVASQPWAQVAIDGRVVAESTPAVGLRVAAGVHQVTLTNPRLGLRAVRRVTIRAGQRERLVVPLR